MNKLPEPIWISLQEALDLVLDWNDEDPAKAKRALIDAFAAEKIETKGWGGNYAGSFTAEPVRLSNQWHSAIVSWEKGSFTMAGVLEFKIPGHIRRYNSIVWIIVNREQLERWLESAKKESNTSRPDQARNPLSAHISLVTLTPWLQQRYDEWNGISAGPSILDDWDAALDKFGEGKVTRAQIEKVRKIVNAPEGFQLHKPGPKPKS